MGEAGCAQGKTHDWNADLREIVHAGRPGQVRHRRSGVRRRHGRQVHVRGRFYGLLRSKFDRSVSVWTTSVANQNVEQFFMRVVVSQVCDFLHADNTTLVWDNEQQVPFAYRKDQWIGFDDERSLKTKVPSRLVLAVRK